MSAATVQKVFKTLSDPTRLRLLALLEREELAVGDLVSVLGLGQSRVSTHLGILKEAGLLSDRREGPFVRYRLAKPLEGEWAEAWALVSRHLSSDPQVQRDLAGLGVLLAARAAGTRRFFDQVGAQWDSIRQVLNDEALRARAINRVLARKMTVADVGTGTGVLAAELAQLGIRVIAVDHSPAMLAAARAKLEEQGISGVELRRGDAAALPLADGEVDAAIAHLVLQYAASPRDAVSEMARVVRPGGTVTVVDFAQHSCEWLREELGVQWPGFSESELATWLREAGLRDPHIEVYPPLLGARELPGTLIASAQRP